jgi:hypothetical protein
MTILARPPDLFQGVPGTRDGIQYKTYLLARVIIATATVFQFSVPAAFSYTAQLAEGEKPPPFGLASITVYIPRLYFGLELLRPQPGYRRSLPVAVFLRCQVGRTLRAGYAAESNHQ